MNDPDVITLCSSSSLHYIANFIEAEQATLLLEKWIDEMLWEQSSGLEFNSVLVNWYRNGEDCMGWHSDDEASLGEDPQIASVSLGATRRFILRQKSNKSNKHVVELQHGSLMLMLGRTQSLWQHALPRTKKSHDSRVNLTFRYIRQ